MKRYNVTEGSRAEILAELDQYGSDRAQQGKPDKAREFKHAIDAIKDGADEVRVGHSVYRIVAATEDENFLRDGDIANWATNTNAEMAG